MSIRKKTLSIVGGVVFALVIVLVVTSYILVTRRFARLEVEDTRIHVQRVTNELNTILSHLESTVGDWAPWDDTYQFIQDRNSVYVENNLVDSTFINLHLNFMLFYNKEGRLVYRKFFQFNPSQTYVTPESVQAAVDRYPVLLSHLNKKSRISGILATSSTPYLVASHPIVSSDFNGPIHGTLVIGRALDNIETERLRAITKIKATFKTLPENKNELSTAARPLAAIIPGEIYTVPVSATQINGYAKISDLSGNSNILLEITQNRDIYHYGFSTWRLNAFALIGFGVVFIFVLMFLLNRIVLTPLASLTERVNSITLSADRFGRVDLNSANEIGQLAESINDMLAAIQDHNLEKASNEQYLRELLDSINCGVVVVDAQDRRIIDVNKAGALLYRRDRDELIGRKCHQLVCPNGADSCPILDQEKTILNSESTLIKSDGTFLPILKSATKIQRRGRTYLIESFFDISKRKEAENNLRESQERYRRFFEEDITADFLISVDGTVIDCNPAFARMFGYDYPEEVKSFTLEKHYPLKEHRQMFLRQLRRERRLEGLELELRHRDNRPLYCIGNLIGHFDAAGKVVQIRGYLYDDTKRIKLEKDFRRAQKMEAIGTLAGGIAHDFNNILAGIMGYTEIAMSDLPESSPTVERLQKVMQSANRAKDLVHQILAFSRQNEDQNHPLSLKPIVKEVVKLMRASLPTTIEIREKFGSEASVMANPVQIHQLIMNLCTNAAHAMKKDGGCLTITAADTRLDQSFSKRFPGVNPGAFVCISVTDTGGGIPPNIVDRIFDPFFSTKDKNEATGLGLSVVHGIVSKLRGAVDVESSSSGTTFNVYLPIIEKKKRQAAAALSPSLPTGSETVVFIDDEELLVDIGTQMLGKLGYRTHAFLSSMKALEYILANADAVDLVITDMTMPDLTGLAIAGRLQETLPHLPIIICTGYSEDISSETAFSKGIKGYVMKPMVIKELAEKVRNVLDAGKNM